MDFRVWEYFLKCVLVSSLFKTFLLIKFIFKMIFLFFFFKICFFNWFSFWFKIIVFVLFLILLIKKGMFILGSIFLKFKNFIKSIFLNGEKILWFLYLFKICLIILKWVLLFKYLKFWFISFMSMILFLGLFKSFCILEWNVFFCLFKWLLILFCSFLVNFNELLMIFCMSLFFI